MNRNTLQNPMLYKNFVTHLAELNPHVEIDPAEIDESLEWEEAARNLEQKYPGLKTFRESSIGPMSEYREYLADHFDITDRTMQNSIMSDAVPWTETELNELSYAVHGRSHHALNLDRHMKARITDSLRRWMKRPNRLDFKRSMI